MFRQYMISTPMILLTASFRQHHRHQDASTEPPYRIAAGNSPRKTFIAANAAINKRTIFSSAHPAGEIRSFPPADTGMTKCCQRPLFPSRQQQEARKPATVVRANRPASIDTSTRSPLSLKMAQPCSHRHNLFGQSRTGRRCRGTALMRDR